MPSWLHESHLLLFRNQPALAVELMRCALGVDVPPHKEARVVSADLTEVQPAEYRADMVVQLFDDASVFGIVVEVQLSVDERKRFVWPAYVSTLRARLECPVCLLVITADDAVARWAAKSVDMGGLHQFAPYVLGPSGVPEITDEGEARANPELAVLSAMAHGRDRNIQRSACIAMSAQIATAGLDADRSGLYFDLILNSLSEAARDALGSMDAQTYEYQSEFARRYLAQGVAQGEATGRAAVIARLLTVRFGPLSAEAESRLERASIPELDAMAERLLVAHTLQEALGGG
jgi:hypothetical protein